MKKKDRPKEIVFQITRTYEVDGKTIPDETFHQEVILKKEDAQTPDIWEKGSLPDQNILHTMRELTERNITIHTISVKQRLTVTRQKLLIQRTTSIITAL